MQKEIKTHSDNGTYSCHIDNLRIVKLLKAIGDIENKTTQQIIIDACLHYFDDYFDDYFFYLSMQAKAGLDNECEQVCK